MLQKKREQIKLGLVGATGLVGKTFLKVLEEWNWSPLELRLFSSEKSEGQTLKFFEKDLKISSISEGCFKGLDIVFFSAGDEISLKYAPQAVKDGAYVIDNSAAFRQNSDFPLVVPECNGGLLEKSTTPTIIANPNCSTIQMVVVLQALRNLGNIEDIKVATYQSVSGAGLSALEELREQTRNCLSHNKSEEALKNKNPTPSAFTKPIRFNLIPQIGGFDPLGFTSEENKMIHETRKIMQMPHLKVSAFAVRVPVMVGHSEVVWVRFDRTLTLEQVRGALENAPGVRLPDSGVNGYFTPIEVAGRDEVFVGRVHQDFVDPQTWIFWIVADNLRKGAATNGLQIAQALLRASN